ncbi:MAG: CDP-alcohol phosphatidyltransferase family protein [Deltaproteobacteria bacterium]|jgi:hypothetical protein|nr:CDP-alcohol phosphatidyltransferase family protein [Deltaproteobacteria bacterium]MBW2537725.1 CDP-alcohol phosphatidyltransferase family protein [Deltaproteobacteria bacterium]
MSLWREYRSTLKALEVEEPIDLALHRPPAFLVAKLAALTPITPNQVTLLSMLVGIAGGACLFLEGTHTHLIAAALLVVSQIFDCADGMLARMRRASSDLGRMLDGTADAITLIAATAGSIFLILRMYPEPWYVVVLYGALCWITIHTSSFHTSAYDHYKNVFQRFSDPDSGEGEDLDDARARWKKAKARRLSLVERFVWAIYLNYLKSQRRLLGWFDPHTSQRMSDLPPWTAERAAAYRRAALAPMRVWAGLFGVGSLVFGLALFNAIGRPDWFMWYRAVGLNAVFLLYLLPAQRRASRVALQSSAAEQAARAPVREAAR